MRLLDATNLESYLRETGRIAPGIPVRVEELAGGVSNVVLLVTSKDGSMRFVVKQARQQLRVPEPWFCGIERIWREVDVLEVVSGILQSVEPVAGNELAASAPSILFRDTENFLYAMTAAPPHEVWKSQLLRGDIQTTVAEACGRMLGRIHASTWQRADVAEAFGDRHFFDALRLDPYYRHIGRTRPQLEASMNRLIESLEAHPRCLVHGDFSPKNILVHAGGLTLVDFEVGHYGDPAFDLGFFLTHLFLKGVRDEARQQSFDELSSAFWARYRAELLLTCGEMELDALRARAVQQLAGCMLARVDGKSRVDYLTTAQQDYVRRLAESWLAAPPRDPLACCGLSARERGQSAGSQ